MMTTVFYYPSHTSIIHKLIKGQWMKLMCGVTIVYDFYEFVSLQVS